MSDQIGQFLKVIGEKFAYKSSANISMIFWSILESNTFKWKPEWIENALIS